MADTETTKRQPPIRFVAASNDSSPTFLRILDLGNDDNPFKDLRGKLIRRDAIAVIAVLGDDDHDGEREIILTAAGGYRLADVWLDERELKALTRWVAGGTIGNENRDLRAVP